MALSVVDLYARVLPRTNCGDCGFPTCLAFAGMVVSKIKSMQSHVETPLRNHFGRHPQDLIAAANLIGGCGRTFLPPAATAGNAAFVESGFEAEVKSLFDETISEHLDIESILFLSEHLANLLIS